MCWVILTRFWVILGALFGALCHCMRALALMALTRPLAWNREPDESDEEPEDRPEDRGSLVQKNFETWMRATSLQGTAAASAL